jgi:hypothetical protein
MTDRQKRTRTGTFAEFKDFTLAVARGERQIDPNEPKIWIETPFGDTGLDIRGQAAAPEGVAKLNSDQNRQRPKRRKHR